MAKIKRLLGLILFAGCFSVAMAQNTADTITIFSFNDYHGAFVKDKSSGIPGAAVFVQALLNAKQNSPNPIIVSAGDNFSGSYFARITRGQPIKAIFDTLGVKVSAVGNHEFDWGKPYLLDTAANYISYIAANIFDSTGVLINKIPQCKVVEVPVFKGGDKIKIGFVGLTTTETGTKTNPKNIEKLSFIPPAKEYVSVLCDSLKNKVGVDLVVILMHIGTKMNNRVPEIMEADADSIPYASNNNAMISGHSHNVVLGTINNIPVVQAGTNGAFIGEMQFKVTKEGAKNSIIEYIKGDTIKVDIFGEENVAISDTIAKYVKEYGFDEMYACAIEKMIHDRRINRNSYTEVGSLVTASYVAKYTDKKFPVVGVNHFNGIRAGLPQGKITKLRAGNVLPFGGNLVAFKFLGKSLKKLLTDGRNNTNGYLQTSNLILYRSVENDSITRIFQPNGKEIKDLDTCVVLCDEFIALGGDGYDKMLFNNKIKDFNYETTLSFLEYLKTQDCLPSENARPPIVCDGTQKNPYRIMTFEGLAELRDSINNGANYGNAYFLQTQDIDLSSVSVKNWIPAGTKDKPFQGHYDGSGKVIRNLTVNQQGIAGLFGYMDGGSITNVTIYRGNICGTTAGGICGFLASGKINNSKTCSGRIYSFEDNSQIGGICGYLQAGEISNCNNILGWVEGKSEHAKTIVGGIVGAVGSGTIDSCQTNTPISNTNGAETGGICGKNDNGTLSKCLNLRAFIKTASACGGICGQNSGAITDCAYDNENLPDYKYLPAIGGGLTSGTRYLTDDEVRKLQALSCD